MKTIAETYRDRLKLLVKEYKTQAALAKALDKAPAQLSQWINASPDSKTGRPRSLDAKSAREIEEKLNKPNGWMDQPLFDNLSESIPISSRLKKNSDTIKLDLFDVSASCGGGRINSEYPELIRSIEFPIAAALDMFGTTKLNGIQLMPPDGDSMEPTIPKKSITMINTKINTFQGSGIYLINFQGYEYIKRLHRGKGGIIKVTSDNPNYTASDFDIEPNEMDELVIHGKMWKVMPIEVFDI